MQSVYFGDVNAATARVLAMEGCEVVVPTDQGCCGALMEHAGEEESALRFARRMIATMEDADVDTIVINDLEAAALPGSHVEAPAMETDELLHERKADAGPFVRSGAGVRDPMKTLEDVRKLIRRNPDPGVGDSHFRRTVAGAAIPSRVTAGWGHGTPSWAPFFRGEIVAGELIRSPAPDQER